ncbi:S9 family peptidase [Komagataeibacter nataicola]|uniref:S9 family peptidase n=1 Tax=Komagataeibacter nataicola TaxID=265960 RepID=A0A9N7C8G7_9PROT|nr:prolyl oligopeptidase family serine peptidase [Komagataeibacter nataicola]AQU87643.1 S9 family peptidase [Komagataeibacter nataicola]PYD66989.1 S9 family peptidase [Komagataeibacter nataicola]WEQ55380.1 prolyl oligopeptidase family serine peptidase [Komagataeibacter nataicola]GBR17786.1 peptidase S9 [Komagataeibacter nataicola NRIC 0616]
MTQSRTSGKTDIETSPYGTWPSPVSAALVAGQTVSLSDVRVDGRDIYWIEGRPAEGGRRVLVRARAGQVADVTPAPFDVGTRVHEYGGGAYAVCQGRVALSNRRDGSVWLMEGGQSRCLAAGAGLRFADLTFSADGRFLFCVREDHGVAEGEPAAAIVVLDCTAMVEDPAFNGGTPLVMGPDFLSSPRPSPDGRYLAWIEWDHPAMPWDATRLRVATLLQEGSDPPRLAAPWTLAGDDGQAESVIEPGWDAAGRLLALSDRSGWWNLYRFDTTASAPVALAPMQAEIGQPHWIFGLRSYALLADGTILAMIVNGGEARMACLRDGVATPVALGHPSGCPVPVEGGGFAWLDVPPDNAAAVVTGMPGQPPHVLRRATDLPLGAADIALPRAITFPLPSGDGLGQAFFYAPTSSRHVGPAGEKPPLVVMAHGGPTGRASAAFSFKVQWWTSRGFAVVDVNYGGSTGFGRAYRQRLEGQWGVVDVDDCIAACHYLADRGLVDPTRIVIRGSSAGGLTVLLALARSELFAAGTSLYGVTDLRALATDTHKFESRYLDTLVGPYPADEATYLARSPLTQVAHIRAPVLFLQGLDDKVVPPSQARSMVEALRGQGVPCALYEFAGEGHGFRQEATIRQAWELELAFYQQVLRLPVTPALPVELKA